jgi:hypothetical protein
MMLPTEIDFAQRLDDLEAKIDAILIALNVQEVSDNDCFTKDDEPVTPPLLDLTIGCDYILRDGRTARVLHIIEEECEFPIIGIIEGDMYADHWKISGRYFARREDGRDMIRSAGEVRPSFDEELEKAREWVRNNAKSMAMRSCPKGK